LRRIKLTLARRQRVGKGDVQGPKHSQNAHRPDGRLTDIDSRQFCSRLVEHGHDLFHQADPLVRVASRVLLSEKPA
jgi:hypothetical protein